MESLKIAKIHKHAIVPTRRTAGSVGYDISACLSEDVSISPNEVKKIGSGISISLNEGYAAFIYARSGLGINFGITPANCVGVIDSDYTGEIIVGLKNSSNEFFTIKHGDRIAQMVITKCETPNMEICDTLPETKRGDRRFGSTGVES